MSLNIYQIQPWRCWVPNDYCKVCADGPFSVTFEIAYTNRNSGATGYISEACQPCTRRLIDQDPDWATQEFWNNQTRRTITAYFDVGLISHDWLQLHNVLLNEIPALAQTQT